MSAGFDPRLAPLILSLGLDTFAVSTGVGLAPLTRRARLRLILLFAAAEGLMPALGVALGHTIGAVLGSVGTYVAGGLLIATGLYMLREAREEDDDGDDETTRLATAAAHVGLPLLALAISVSLDELAVGLSFGVLRLPLGPTLIAIALQAAVVSALGLWLGARIGRAIGRRAELVAALVLLALGVAIVLARLSGHTFF